jgi:hypothetical protein
VGVRQTSEERYALHEQDVGAHMVCFFGAFQTSQQRINDLEAKIIDLEQVVTE